MIEKSPKDPRLLTEHQKEKLRTPPVLPPMYTSVEPSLNTQPFEVQETMEWYVVSNWWIWQSSPVW